MYDIKFLAGGVILLLLTGSPLCMCNIQDAQSNDHSSLISPQGDFPPHALLEETL